MPYTLVKTDGTTLTTIADGSRDTTTSLTFAGPNFVGYGQYLNENLLYLLENFAGDSAPSNTNLQGQLWFDKFNQILKVFTNQGYVPVSGVTNSSSQPAQGKNGDIWFNTSTEQMYLYDTANTPGFKLIGPLYTRQQGITGAVGATIEDGSISGIYHNVLKLQFGNLTYATVSADSRFTPTGGSITGFSSINAGITFSSNVAGASINANIVTSDGQTVLFDIVNRQITGTLNGNVVATTLSGNLTGNVVGNLVGNVVATTLSGNHTGNSVTTNSTAINFSSSNVLITGGGISGLSGLSTAQATATVLSATTAQATNFSSGNILVAGGSALGLSAISATTAQATNFSSGNILVTGGSATGLTALSSTSIQATNFSSGNILVTGGSATGLTSFSTALGQSTNFSSANVLIAGGNIAGLTALSTNTAQATNFSSANVLIAGGNVSGVAGANNTFTAANLINSVATTKSVADSSTAIATTAYVHNYLPTGIIVMWNSTAASIPTGWQLCDGSNGTPDLRGQFIVGAGGSYTPGDTGGSASVTLSANAMPIHTHTLSGALTTGSAGSHSHTASVTDPGHTHTSGVPSDYNAFGTAGISTTYQKTGSALVGTSPVTSSSSTGVSVGITTALDHTHSLTLSGNTQSAGGSGGTTQPHENRPPYYALCYIQKM